MRNIGEIIMDAIVAILTRRSTRRFDNKIPNKELIQKVVNAGRYAPSGANSQTSHFLVITNKEVLKEIAELVQGEFAKMEISEDMYVSLKGYINASKKGDYVFHYNAPVLIVTANKKGYGNAIADSSCALENMMIAANAFDLGSCWINQLHWLDDNERIRAFLEGYGLKKDETITGGLALGFSENGLPNRKPLDRKGNVVTWVE
jgi:nitroreductase